MLSLSYLAATISAREVKKKEEKNERKRKSA